MNLDRILELISILTWLLVVTFGAISFVRHFQEFGITYALRKLVSFSSLALLLIPILLSLLSASLVFVPPQQTAVVISFVSPNGFRAEPLSSGVHFIVPLAEQAVFYPIYWQNYTMSGRTLEGEVVGDDAIVARTIDGQEVALDCSVIFRIDRDQVVSVHIDWQDRYIAELVRPRTRGLVRSLVARYTVDEVNSLERTNLERDLDQELRTILEDRGFNLDAFVLRNIAFSPEYASAVEEKQVAEQGQERSRFQAEQIRNIARGEADAIEFRAQAEANAILIKAEAEAQALERINQAIEQNSDLLTYQYINRLSPNISVMLVPNNAPIVLPFAPGMLSGTPIAPKTSASPTAVPLTTPTVTPTPTPTVTPTP